MSRRNHYESAFGVCPLQWQRGEPDRERGPVVVEVWRPDLVIDEYTPGTLPTVRVHAQLEVRVWVEDQKSWQRIDYRGRLVAPPAGDVRRWAELPHRWWSATVKLDGWDGVR